MNDATSKIISSDKLWWVNESRCIDWLGLRGIQQTEWHLSSAEFTMISRMKWIYAQIKREEEQHFCGLGFLLQSQFQIMAWRWSLEGRRQSLTRQDFTTNNRGMATCAIKEIDVLVIYFCHNFHCNHLQREESSNYCRCRMKDTHTHTAHQPGGAWRRRKWFTCKQHERHQNAAERIDMLSQHTRARQWTGKCMIRPWEKDSGSLKTSPWRWEPGSSQGQLWEWLAL